MNDLAGETIELPMNVTDAPDDPPPCDFCSSAEHEALVMERGFITADYRLENTYGVVMAHSCEMCIAEAPRRD